MSRSASPQRTGAARSALVVLGAAAILAAVSPAAAQEPQLPLTRVVIFSSGVAYFERAGQVDGDAQVELAFRADDINDLLKSMVLEDRGGGQIGAVTFSSKDPITRTLKTFAIDLTDNPTLGELLAQVRGQRVELSGQETMSGTIIGIEKRPTAAGEVILEQEVLNLLTDAGLRSIPLVQIGSLKLADPQLNSELQQALAVLATGHDTDKKTVRLDFRGQGTRDVRVGYVQEAPLWKTSYRLVLGDDGEALLQGWAIVENTGEEDWQNVALTLVSGRPISFMMDLYDPLYIERPLVELELFAGLRPQRHDRDLAESPFDEMEPAAAAPPSAKRLLERADAALLGRAAGAAGAAGGMESFALDAAAGVAAMAEAGDVGELFQYVIQTPVELPRQQSAMLPIVQGDVAFEKVSLYNPAVHARHPLSGLALTNSTPVHLMQGPITVFDGGAYAGDAQIADLPPAERSLVTYALDLDTEVVLRPGAGTQEVVGVQLARGVLIASQRLVREEKYELKNSDDRPRRVLVEVPILDGWELVSPQQPTEVTRGLYRFAVDVSPGSSGELVVNRQQVIRQDVQLSNINDDQIRFYLRARQISPAVREALQEIIRRKGVLANLSRDLGQVQAKIASIGQEQERIRNNLARLQQNTELYNRYIKMLGEQEDEMATLRTRADELTAEINKHQADLDKFLLELDLS